MKVGLFTDPYPEELLYSACARYDDRMRYPNRAAALYELFGSNSTAAMVDLPVRINQLLAALPPFHNYTADSFIYKNTLFPYYVPFLPAGRQLKLKDDMRRNGGRRVRERVGLTAGSICLPTALRFCPLCVSEDRSKYRETYWHRVHQIAGINVCPYHAVFLEDSRAPWRDRRNPYRFFSAEKSVYDIPPRKLTLSDPLHSIFLEVAQNAAWLLRWSGSDPDLNALRDRYFNLLLERGYAYYNGRIKGSKLLKALNDFFTPTYLAEIQCEIGLPSYAWPLRIALKDGTSAAQNPLKHLLLMAFLGCTAEQLFTAFVEFKPFGSGPWPCLNRASRHYGNLLIEQNHVTDSLVRNSKPEGIFACKCGFVYKRVGPDISDADHFTYSSVQIYGPTWERMLQRLWPKTELPLKEVGSQLGVSDLTVVRHAIRLGLSMNRSGARRVSQKTIKRYSKYRDTRQNVTKVYRHEWVEILRANPHARRHELIRVANFLYLWLKKNDRAWMEAHLPKSQAWRTPPRGRTVNWKRVDQTLAKDVIAAATHIRAIPGKPTRVSLAAIIRAVGRTSWISKHLDRLSLTAEAISKHAESLSDFLIRKVLWAEEHYRRVGIQPTRAQLIRYAAVNNKAGRMPAVQNVVDSAMDRLPDVFP